MKRKLIKLLFATIVISGFYAGIASAAPLALNTDRLGGVDRVATAIEVSNEGWKKTANTVILSELKAYPDALSATPLARQLDAPILLTDGKTLDPRVSTELKRLNPTHIVILGGEALISSALAKSLEKPGLEVERIGGKDRYETSAMIAKKIPSDTVIFVNGDNFPDALVSAPYAGIKQIPLLLTQARGIPEPIRQVYSQRNPTHVLVVGGTTAVPDSTLNNISVEKRIGGVDRYDTAANIYRYAQATYSSSTAYIASGEVFADAMVGAALAAKTGAPLFLTKATSLPATTTSVLSSAATQTNPIQTICILGGTSVVSTGVSRTLEGKPVGLLGDQIIVVDPGHGTPDPGAVGPAGTKEKDNNWAIALKLTTLLRAAGAQVYLTRNGDGSPASPYNKHDDLWSRVNTANALNATLFISIHSNAWTPESHGTETYYSNSFNEFHTEAESYKLAKAIQDKVVQNIGRTDRGVKDGDFTVLNHTKMPAVLVEVAFTSNPTEEQLLANDSFRMKAATGIYQGILTYKGL